MLKNELKNEFNKVFQGLVMGVEGCAFHPE